MSGNDETAGPVPPIHLVDGRGNDVTDRFEWSGTLSGGLTATAKVTTSAAVPGGLVRVFTAGDTLGPIKWTIA